MPYPRPTMRGAMYGSSADYPPPDKRHFRFNWWASLWALLEWLVFVSAVVALAAPYWIDPPDPQHHLSYLRANPTEPLASVTHAGLWQACFADTNAAGTQIDKRYLDCCTRQVHRRLYRHLAGRNYHRYVKAAEGLTIGFAAFTLGKLLWGWLAFSSVHRAAGFATYMSLALTNAVLQLMCAAATLAIFGWMLRDAARRSGSIPGMGAFRHLVGWCYWLFLASSALSLATLLLLCFAFV